MHYAGLSHLYYINYIYVASLDPRQIVTLSMHVNLVALLFCSLLTPYTLHHTLTDIVGYHLLPFCYCRIITILLLQDHYHSTTVGSLPFCYCWIITILLQSSNSKYNTYKYSASRLELLVHQPIHGLQFCKLLSHPLYNATILLQIPQFDKLLSSF